MFFHAFDRVRSRLPPSSFVHLCMNFSNFMVMSIECDDNRIWIEN